MYSAPAFTSCCPAALKTMLKLARLRDCIDFDLVRPCVASKRLVMSSNSAMASRLNRGCALTLEESTSLTCCPSTFN